MKDQRFKGWGVDYLGIEGLIIHIAVNQQDFLSLPSGSASSQLQVLLKEPLIQQV